ncbi:MAG: hypothetical protein WC196_02910 [Bacilli bacterium]
MAKKLYEFSALVRYSLVVAAKNEIEARNEIAGLERAWFQKGDVIDVSDVEITDIRNPKSSDLTDEAHIIV